VKILFSAQVDSKNQSHTSTNIYKAVKRIFSAGDNENDNPFAQVVILCGSLSRSDYDEVCDVSGKPRDVLKRLYADIKVSQKHIIVYLHFESEINPRLKNLQHELAKLNFLAINYPVTGTRLLDICADLQGTYSEVTSYPKLDFSLSKSMKYTKKQSMLRNFLLELDTLNFDRFESSQEVFDFYRRPANRFCLLMEGNGNFLSKIEFYRAKFLRKKRLARPYNPPPLKDENAYKNVIEKSYIKFQHNLVKPFHEGRGHLYSKKTGGLWMVSTFPNAGKTQAGADPMVPRTPCYVWNIAKDFDYPFCGPYSCGILNIDVSKKIGRSLDWFNKVADMTQPCAIREHSKPPRLVRAFPQLATSNGTPQMLWQNATKSEIEVFYARWKVVRYHSLLDRIDPWMVFTDTPHDKLPGQKNLLGNNEEESSDF